MKTKNMLWAALSMTAALVMTACSNDDNMVETPAAPQDEVKTIPYTVTVNGGEGGATTRATVADDPSVATNYHKTLYFADGDKLYVTGTNIKGVLNIQTGMGTASATFSGNLTYSGSGTPDSDLSLTATLVSAQQTDGSEVTINATTGAVTVNYPTTSYCGDVNDAVQKYSNLTGTSPYSAKSFTLTQQTAFLNFVITFDDGTTAGTELSAAVSNNSAAICTANVTTVTDNGVKAKFVLPVAKGTTLSSANVKMGDKAAISFGASQTLTGKVYNVTKTQAAAVTTLNNTIKAWTAGTFAVPAGGLTYSDAITVSGDVTLVLTDGETLTLNKGISLAEGATLTIQGNGTMNVNGTNSSTASTVAGTGTLVLTSGTLTAKGGNGAGYGDNEMQTSGSRSAGGVAINGAVTVSGGTLTATGGAGGSIGSMNGNDVTAGAGGAAISGSVTLSSGTLTATGGNGGNGGQFSGGNAGAGGAAIGGDLTVNGGTMTTTNGSNGVETVAPTNVNLGAGGKAVAGTVTDNR